jgi:hypothetical protein
MQIRSVGSDLGKTTFLRKSPVRLRPASAATR